MKLPTDAKARKAVPIYTGFIKYFPDAVAAVAQLSFDANEQHNPGEPVHWAKEKSTDEDDALMRHLLDPLTAGGDLYDEDGTLHATKVAWRAMARLQRLLYRDIPVKRPGTVFGIVVANMIGRGIEHIRTPEGSEVRICFACQGQPLPHVCGRGLPEPREADTEAVPGLDKLIGPGDVVAGFTKVDGINCCAKCKCPLDRPAPETCTLKSQHQNPPVHCQQCGGELPRHFAGCLSHAANAGQ